MPGTLLERYQQYAEEARKTDEYWVEDVILSFTDDLSERIESVGLSRADFARQIGKSKSYVTRILKGNANFTIETMVRLSRAVGCLPNIELRPESVVSQPDTYFFFMEEEIRDESGALSSWRGRLYNTDLYNRIIQKRTPIQLHGEKAPEEEYCAA